MATFGITNRVKKGVVFDIGGVILFGDTRGLVDRLFADRPESQRPYGMMQVYKTEMWSRLDRGTLSYADAIVGFDQPSVTKEDFSFWLSNFFKHMTSLPGGSTILAGLRAKGTPRFVLSNFHKESFEIISQQLHPETFGIPHGMTDHVVSYITHHNKPEPEMYQDLKDTLKKHGIQPEEVFFLDDTWVNVTGAWDNGVAAIRIKPANTGHDFAEATLKYFNLM